MFDTDIKEDVLACQSFLHENVPQSEIVFQAPTRQVEITIVDGEDCSKPNKPNKPNKALEIENDPLSNQEKINHCKKVAFDLYNKYIKIESKYEVNISWDERNKLICQLDDKHEWMNQVQVNETDLYYLFESTRLEMYKLMVFSYLRIKSYTKTKIKAILRNQIAMKNETNHIDHGKDQLMAMGALQLESIS